VLEIRHLSRPGLEPADLSLGRGECIALSGPSGSGKSIFMRAIADLDPNTGDVSLDGRSRDALPAPDWRRAVVYVPAEAGWWAERVGEHFPDPDIAVPMAVRLGLPVEGMEWEVARLSTGEKQRLALSRAFLTTPKVLLLDEPTSGLDPDATAKVEGLLRERIDSGVAVMLVTHDRDQAARLASRRFVMEKGVLSAMDAP
jgi:ABC-type iron transport system FetAB ATPase subunit